MIADLMGLLLWLQATLLLLPAADPVEYACAVSPPVATQFAPASPQGQCRPQGDNTVERCALLQVEVSACHTEKGPVRLVDSSLLAKPLRRLHRPVIGCASPAGATCSGLAERLKGAAAATPELGGFATIG